MTDYRPLLEQALGAIDQLESRLADAERVRSEPIAIVGIGCRFPGGADDPEAFWRLLETGVNAVSEVPADRWDIEKYYSADPDAPGTMYARHAGFLDRVDRFDPTFFGIAPREARTLDPQQRLILEVAWEALENAGHAPTALRGSSTGVFVGIGGSDFAESQLTSTGLGDVDAYMGSGSGVCFAAGRLSYVLGLRGPSMVVDTACSGSLVALHLAANSLRQRECDVALAGGVHVILSPAISVYLSRTHALAADGRCKAFDAAADGFVRGEGCGMVVLKRLSDAVAAGDDIVAVIRGSAVNQDGASSGLTVPNGAAQSAVISAALQRAGIAPAAVGFVEAHGTGTSLGDPIEMNALCETLGENRPANAPLVVGSVKANIGHLEAAAGVAGFIKAALAIKRGVVPPQLHFSRLNPEIDLQGTTVVIPQKAYAWPAPAAERFAGVSSFGLSGTNAHIVLGAAPDAAASAGVERSRDILRITARTPAALTQLAERVGTFLTQPDAPTVADLCYTANTGRGHFAHRAVIVGDSRAAFAKGLSSLAGKREDARVITGSVDREGLRVAFLFPGSGSQFPGMGKGLFDTQPVFRDALEQCDALLRPHLDVPLLDILYPRSGSPTLIDNPRYMQSVLFAFEYALATTWLSWGVRPTAMIGHSLGEYVAACVSGVMPLPDALGLVATRGRLMSELPPGGAMAAVFATEERVRDAIASDAGPISISAVNGPENVVISGASTAVQRVCDSLARDGIDARMLNVQVAYHSALLDPMLDTFERAVAGVNFGRATIPIVSNLTGEELTEAQQRDPRYWRRHAREVVRFADGIRALSARGIRAFLEVGPHTTVSGMATPSLPKTGSFTIPSLRKGRDDWEQILESVATLYVRGGAIDWEAIDAGVRKRRVTLPTYPFQRERYWPENRESSAARPSTLTHTHGHPVLAGKMELADDPGTVVWEGALDLTRHRFIDDHRVQGVPVVPATLYIELALAAGTDGAADTSAQLSSMHFHRPLLLRQDSPAAVQVKLARDSSGALDVRIHSRSDRGNAWTLNATATLRTPATDQSFVVGESLAAVQARCASHITGRQFYERMARRGNQWGPAFQGVTSVWQGDNEALSLIELAPSITDEIDDYYLHPALADASGQVLAATISLEASDGPRGGAFVGGGIDTVRLLRRPRGRRFWSHAKLRPTEPGDDGSVLVGDVTLMNEAGETLCVSEGCRFWYLDHETEQPRDSRVGAYQVEWVPVEPAAKSAAIGLAHVVIIGDDAGVAQAVRERLRATGVRVDVVDRDAQPQDFPRLLAGEGTSASPITVLYLRGLDRVGGGIDSANTPERCANLTLGLQHLVQAIVPLSSSVRARVWTVTAGAQAVGAHPQVDPAQSTLWGLGRTIASEHRELWGGLVDVDPAADATAKATQILEVVTRGDSEANDQFALRGGELLAPRLRRRPIETGKFACRADAAYVVTGGLGGIGFEVASWLVDRGAKHLVLAGRSAFPPRSEWGMLEAGSTAHDQARRMIAFEERGVQVEYVSIDIGDVDRVFDFVARRASSGARAIAGIAHAAGVMQYRPFIAQTDADVQDIFRAKVFGAWNLHRTLGNGLDFFVLFSSAAAILDSPLVGAYAAANGFLDGLAHWRREHGATALSINWGVWNTVGMGARVAAANPGDARDTDHSFTPEEGIGAMERLMTSDASQATVLGVDWTRWRNQYPQLAASPFMRDLMVEPATGAATATTSATSNTSAVALLASQPEERSRSATLYIAECVAAVLGFNPDQIDEHTPISGLGFDSMMALELKNRISRELQIVIPLVRFLDGPSVTQLGGFVSKELEFRGTAATSSDVAVSSVVVSPPAQVWEEGEL